VQFQFSESGKLMLRLLALVLFFLPGLASAQGAPRTILVLDGSGSMWGQIDGVNKIVIAREVIEDLLATLPPEQELGLMSYGHRRKGDCADIELLIEPGTDRAAIAAAVNAINPKGKTPLSAAVIEAAQALRHTEEAATVILVSDGIETCNLDPCAVGRELEAAGVNFTAHVIGFDVADPEALAQLQCLADETGGMFRTAGNAAELAQALDVVVTAPEPEPVILPAPVTFRAIAGEDGPEITEGLVWTIGTDAAGPIITDDMAPTQLLEILPGSGRAEVLRLSDEASADAGFTVVDGSAMTVTLVLPEILPDASLDAPASAPAGSLVPVRWSGPDAERDYISAADPGTEPARYHHYAYTRDSEDNVAMLRLPPDPGSYEIRYVLGTGKRQLASRTIEVTPLEIALTPPEAATIGAREKAGWQGPDYQRDYLAVASPDQDDAGYLTYAYTSAGNPVEIEMPGEPGVYELRYVLGISKRVVGRASFEVSDVASSVSGPAEAPAGATISVDWSGPDAQNDYIAIAPVGADDSSYEAYTYTRQGAPLELTLPTVPGDYELRYVLNADRKVLARTPITLTGITASLDAPDSAGAGSELSVGWSGPDYDRDFVSIAPVGSDDGAYVGYAYTRNGNPARFQAPTDPGAYELRYTVNGSPDEVLARRAITIEAVDASLSAPASAPIGSVVSVDWTGPASTGRDYIAIAAPDDPPNRYVAYEYTRGGSPAEIQAPVEPGSYELRYVQAGSPNKVLAAVALEVTPYSVTFDAPATASAGSEIRVDWVGTANYRDYVAIAEPGAKPNDYVSYAYARMGTPLELDVPDTPGTYELRYVLSGPAGSAVIGTAPLIVE
jgi:Ca-activated chloride channel homolog